MSKNKLVAAVAGLVLVIAVSTVGITLFNRGAPAGGPTAAPTPAPIVQVAVEQPSATPESLASLAVDTPVPSTDTPVAPPPSETPSPLPPTASPTAVIAIQPTRATQPTAAAKPAQAKPTTVPPKPTKDPNLLPNGVRYGDHYPKLPDRIVRIASPDIKLDTKVYEVYAVKGAWEVADYAGGHNYNSANPGEGGNIVVSGHNNYRGEVFRYLEFLKPGNEIDVWTLEGKEYKYSVESVEKLKEAGVPMAERLEHGKVMDPTPFEQLTLITCWPYMTYTHRLIVVAKPVQ